MHAAGWHALLWGLTAAGSGVAAWLGLRDLRRARELEDTPPSRIRSAAQGYVQLLGRPRPMPGPRIQSPLTGTPCVWWHYRISVVSEERNEVIAEATSDDLFYLSDTSGDCIVDPVGASVQPNVVRRWRGHRRQPPQVPPSRLEATLSSGNYRYFERLVTGDALLLARGWFRTQAAVQASDESRDLALLLAEWKRDRRELLRRFDANRNGRIDPEEWECARAAALEEVRTERVDQQTLPDVNVLGQPPDRREFLLAAVPRHAMQRRYRLRAWALLATAALGAAFALALLR